MNILDNNLNLPIYTIHDCFATTPNNMAKLEAIIKNIKMLCKNILTKCIGIKNYKIFITK